MTDVQTFFRHNLKSLFIVVALASYAVGCGDQVVVGGDDGAASDVLVGDGAAVDGNASDSSTVDGTSSDDTNSDDSSSDTAIVNTAPTLTIVAESSTAVAPAASLLNLSRPPRAAAEAAADARKHARAEAHAYGKGMDGASASTFLAFAKGTNPYNVLDQAPAE